MIPFQDILDPDPTSIDVLGAHSVLVIDADDQGSSRLYNALSISKLEPPAQHPYRFLFFQATGRPSALLASLTAVLRLDVPAVDPAVYEAMLRLRGFAIDWDRVSEALGCCQLVRNFYPDLPIFVSQEGHDDDVRACFEHHRLGDGPHLLYGPERFHSIARVLRRQMDRVVNAHYDAPYWESLRRYAGHPVISFHALPIGQGRSLSPSFSDFAAFYGRRHFTAETSLSTAPLDSLLKPRSTIELAQAKAAKAFGAQVGLDASSTGYGTRFVTNGTSTANSIVISAFVKPDDYVLLDRSCHVSHYHALAYAHARPIVLKPFSNRWGITGPVALQTIKAGFTALLEERNRLPAAIILNNPTFDGFFYRPAAVVQSIRAALSEYWNRYRESPRLTELAQELARWYRTVPEDTTPDITSNERTFIATALRRTVFLFDEAWSAYAYFHPRLIEFTAMHAAWKLAQTEGEDYADCIRFYATQSTHKSLSALRQGSMIHFRDPLMQIAEVRQRFEQAFRAHCTTSPSASIIASLDVARRQAQLEGTQLVDKCMLLAQQFRQEYARSSRGGASHRMFYAVTAGDMMESADPTEPDLSPEDFFLDPTRVTITWEFPLGGATMRQLLLQNSIQVNKYDSRSVLAIFNIGIDQTSVTALCRALDTLGEALFADAAETTVVQPVIPLLPGFGGIYEGRNLGYWLHNVGNLRQEYVDVEDALQTLEQRIGQGPPYLAATFVTPYPPGYPVLVPGQLVTRADLEYLRNLSITEVLGADRRDGRLRIMLYLLDEG